MTYDDWLAIGTGICLAVLIFIVEMIVVITVKNIIETSEDYIDKKTKERNLQ